MISNRNRSIRMLRLASLSTLLACFVGWGGEKIRPLSLNSGYLGGEFVTGNSTRYGSGAAAAPTANIDRSSIGAVTGISGSILGTIFFHDASDPFQIGEVEIVELGLNHTSADDPNQGGIGFDARYGYGLEGNAKVGGGFLVGAIWTKIFDRKTARQGTDASFGGYSEQALSFTDIVSLQLGYQNMAVSGGMGNHGYLTASLRYYPGDYTLGKYYAFEFHRFNRAFDNGGSNTSNEFRLVIGLNFII